MTSNAFPTNFYGIGPMTFSRGAELRVYLQKIPNGGRDCLAQVKYHGPDGGLFAPPDDVGLPADASILTSSIRANDILQRGANGLISGIVHLPETDQSSCSRVAISAEMLRGNKVKAMLQAVPLKEPVLQPNIIEPADVGP